MVRLIDCSFTARVGAELAWSHLTRVGDWPEWAPHIRSAALTPPGSLTADASGAFRLAFGVRSTFVVDGFEPPRRWRWTGPLLTMKIHYDHLLEPMNAERTKFTWTVDATGFGSRTLGRLFAVVYRRNLAVAIPRLVSRLEAVQRTPAS